MNVFILLPVHDTALYRRKGAESIHRALSPVHRVQRGGAPSHAPTRIRAGVVRGAVVCEWNEASRTARCPRPIQSNDVDGPRERQPKEHHRELHFGHAGTLVLRDPKPPLQLIPVSREFQ
jgi:hypothetical protein